MSEEIKTCGECGNWKKTKNLTHGICQDVRYKGMKTDGRITMRCFKERIENAAIASLKERRERLGWSIATAVSKTGTSKSHIVLCEKENTPLDKMLFSERIYDTELFKAEIRLIETLTKEVDYRAELFSRKSKK